MDFGSVKCKGVCACIRACVPAVCSYMFQLTFSAIIRELSSINYADVWKQTFIYMFYI
jgi:hypothetical protein